MSLFSEILQYAISGITSGSIYGIMGICWSLVYLITKVLNFASGEFVMLGGMLTWGFHQVGMPLISAAFMAVVCTTILAILLERIAIRPVRYPSEMTYMMITIASASMIKGMVLLVAGSETRSIDPFLKARVFNVSGATLTTQVLCVVGTLVIITAGLSIFLNLTIYGKALRASAVNMTGARLMGIDINRFRFFCFGLAGAIGAMAGIVITPITFTGYEMGMLIGLKGLVAAIVGGWTIGGTVAAGVTLGLLEGFGAGLISAGLKDVFALGVMIIFLILRTVDLTSLTKRGGS